MIQPKLIIIAGPTASGKSALALDLARRCRGEIINADAMQIYSGLPILTAQPDERTRSEIPHTLYGALDPSTRSSAGNWRTLAANAIKAAAAADRSPILVGGTGLYFRALLGGLADIPPISNEAHLKTQMLYDESGEDKFRQLLAKLDPESASRIAPHDRQRLIRAYEVAFYTGKPLGHWHEKNIPDTLCDFKIEPHLLMPPRAELYAACDKRFESMIERGAIDEARSFFKRALDPSLPAMKTIGLREIGAHLCGATTLEQAIAKGQQTTRNYAKRQVTWFRNQWSFPTAAPSALAS